MCLFVKSKMASEDEKPTGQAPAETSSAENLNICETKVLSEEKTEYSKAYGPKPPYTKPEKPAWFATRNISGFDIKMESGDNEGSRIEKTIHRNASCFDIKVETDAKLECTTQYMRDFSNGSNAKECDDKQEEKKYRVPGVGKGKRIFPVRTQSLELGQKRIFDDDEKANPTLKYFMEFIARK